MSTTTRNILKKLLVIQTTLKAKKGQKNSFGNYQYRSLDDILAAVKNILSEQGVVLTLNDSMHEIAGVLFRKTVATVTCIDDESTMSCDMYTQEALGKKGMSSEQCSGSTASYSGKFCLNKLFAIDDTKDADTQDNSNSNHSPKSQGVAGDFIGNVGKYKGQIIKNINRNDLIAYCSYITKDKPAEGDLKLFIDNARQYLTGK